MTQHKNLLSAKMFVSDIYYKNEQASLKAVSRPTLVANTALSGS